VRQPSSDRPSSNSLNTLSSDSIPNTIYSNRATDNGFRRSPPPNRTKTYNDTSNASEPPQPSAPGPKPMSGSPSSSQPGSPRDGLRTYLGMRKRSTLHDETTLVESPTSGDGDLDRAEIIISPPTPSSSVFLHSAPGPSEGRFGDVSTTGKPAARFVKSHSKRHSLSLACPRKSSHIGHPITVEMLITRPAGKRRSGKRSSNTPTPKSASPVTTPVVESKWRIATRGSQRKKRKSLRIDPPPRSAASPVLIENGVDVGGEMVYEEPVGITRPPVLRSPLTPAKQGPVRTRPYEAPYFFPTPGSPEAFGYVDRVREERRSVLAYPDAMLTRNKKDLKKKSSTISSFEKEGAMGIQKPRGEGGHDQVTEGNAGKQPKSSGKGSWDRDSNLPSSAPIDEFGTQAGAPTKRKSSTLPQFPPSPDTVSTPSTPSRPQVQRQGSLGIMRILGKH